MRRIFDILGDTSKNTSLPLVAAFLAVFFFFATPVLAAEFTYQQIGNRVDFNYDATGETPDFQIMATDGPDAWVSDAFPSATGVYALRDFCGNYPGEIFHAKIVGDALGTPYDILEIAYACDPSGQVAPAVEMQNFIHGWAVIVGAAALSLAFGWKLWKG